MSRARTLMKLLGKRKKPKQKITSQSPLRRKMREARTAAMVKALDRTPPGTIVNARAIATVDKRVDHAMSQAANQVARQEARKRAKKVSVKNLRDIRTRKPAAKSTIRRRKRRS